MAAAFPQSMEAFSRIPGVGEVKLEQYGPGFLEVIRAYAEANGMPDRSDAAPLRQPSGERARSRERERRERRLGPTHDATRSFCPGGCPSPRWRSFAAWRRPQSWATWSSWPLGATSWIWPTSCRRRTGLSEIEAAFEVCGSAYMRPVRDHLGEQFTYDELRLVRMHLRQQGRLPEQETPPD